MSARAASRFDVVVVGARPAGAATAMLLARAGLRVQVLERAEYGTDTVSTHALLRGGVCQLARWGMLDRIESAGTPPVRRCSFQYGEERVDVPIKPGPGFDALYAPRRTVLDPILVDAACAAGAEVRFGVTIDGLRRDSSGRVTGVHGHDERGLPFAADAQVTVGADGIGSTIARLVAARTQLTGAVGAATVYGYWRGLPDDAYSLFYRPGVATGCFPTNDGQTCVFAATEPGRLRSLIHPNGVLGAYTELLDEVAPGLLHAPGVATVSDRVKVFNARPGYLRRSYGPGWALVGDAGYFKDPITSHGITDALRDAELLANAVVTTVSQEAAGLKALAAYQATRDRLSRQLFAITDAIASFTWGLDQIPRLLRELSDAMRDEVDLLTQLESRGVPSGASLLMRWV